MKIKEFFGKLSSLNKMLLIVIPIYMSMIIYWELKLFGSEDFVITSILIITILPFISGAIFYSLFKK